MSPTISKTFTTYGNVGGGQGNTITTYSLEGPDTISVPATTDVQTGATQRQTPLPLPPLYSFKKPGFMTPLNAKP